MYTSVTLFLPRNANATSDLGASMAPAPPTGYLVQLVFVAGDDELLAAEQTRERPVAVVRDLRPVRGQERALESRVAQAAHTRGGTRGERRRRRRRPAGTSRTGTATRASALEPPIRCPARPRRWSNRHWLVSFALGAAPASVVAARQGTPTPPRRTWQTPALGEATLRRDSCARDPQRGAGSGSINRCQHATEAAAEFLFYLWAVF